MRAIFDNAGFLIAGEDVKVAGVKVGSIEEIEVTPEFKAAVVLKIDDPGYQDFRSDASCIVRPQSLIGEKFVECEPTQQRAVGEEAPGELRVIEEGPGEGQRLLPVENTERSVDLDLLNNTLQRALPPAALDHRQRARHRPGRPRRGPQRRDPARQPGAQGARRAAADPRAPERRPREPRRRRRHDHAAARARARARVLVDREHERGRRGDRRAARRPRGELRAPADVPARAAADDDAARRAGGRDDAGDERPRRRRARHQPLPARARPVLAGRHPGARLARRGVR